MIMVEQWELARYLIDAKKALDSLWFISLNLKELFDVRSLCYDKRSLYYINVCAVLDKSICKPSGSKKTLSQSDSIINRIYTERDKHYAHKDKNYVPNFPYSSLEAEAKSLQNELIHIRDICKDYLPKELTLDFVCYDRNLFRQINKISPNDENQIMEYKYPFKNAFNNPNSNDVIKEFRILYDIDDIKNMSEEDKKEYGVVIEDGLTWEEGIQNRQDSMIKANVLFDKDMWFTINHDSWDILIQQREQGLWDKYGVPNSMLYPYYVEFQQNLLSKGE